MQLCAIAFKYEPL